MKLYRCTKDFHSVKKGEIYEDPKDIHFLFPEWKDHFEEVEIVNVSELKSLRENLQAALNRVAKTEKEFITLSESVKIPIKEIYTTSADATKEICKLQKENVELKEKLAPKTSVADIIHDTLGHLENLIGKGNMLHYDYDCRINHTDNLKHITDTVTSLKITEIFN